MKLIKKPGFWLIVLIFVQVLANSVWLFVDKRPPAWDQAAHLRIAVLMGQKLMGETGLSWIEIIRSAYGYPPLIHFLGGIWALVWGIGVGQITFLNTVFMVCLLVGLYKLAEEGLKNKWLALAAVLITSLVPVIVDTSRSFLLDIPLMVWIVWGLYFWLKENDLGVLVMLILASLTKFNGFIYFLPIGGWELWQGRSSEKKLTRLMIGVLIYLLAVGWWWGLNWQNIMAYITGLAGSGEKLTDPMNLMEWQTWIHYLRLFFWTQVTPVAAVLSAILIAVNKKWNRKLMVFLIINYLLFTVIKNKDYRFTMPLLPIVGIIIALGLGEGKKKWRLVVGGLLVGYLAWFMINNSFNWPIKKTVKLAASTFIMGNGDLINISDYPVRSPKSERWPNREIMVDLVSRAVDNGKQKLLVLIDREEINDNNLKLYRDLLTKGGDQELEMHSVYENNFNSWGDFNLVLVGEKDTSPAPFYATNLEALMQAKDFVWSNPEKFQVEKEYQLPDRGRVYLMRIME